MPTNKTYLQLSTTPGDCQDEGYVGWFNVASLTPVFERKPYGRNEIVGFVVTVKASGQSAGLRSLRSAGTIIPVAEIRIFPGKGQHDVTTTYALKDVTVTGFQTGGDPPTDTITLVFGRVRMTGFGRDPTPITHSPQSGWDSPAFGR